MDGETRRNLDEDLDAEAPRISAIVPSYNHERYVQATVESVLTQTIAEPYEVVIVDDGSSDASPRILRELAERDARIRLEIRENRGISATFNRGLELARGDYVAYCCSDDRWHPEHLARSWANLQAHPGSVISFGRARIVDEHDQERPEERVFGELTDLDPLPRLLREGNSLCFVAAVFSRELALELGGFDGEVGVLQDYDLWLKLLQRGTACYLLEPTVDFRWDGDNASGPKASVRKRRDLIRIMERALEFPRVAADHELRGKLLRRLRNSHLRLARRLDDKAEARQHLALARQHGLPGWRLALERAKLSLGL